MLVFLNVNGFWNTSPFPGGIWKYLKIADASAEKFSVGAKLGEKYLHYKFLFKYLIFWDLSQVEYTNTAVIKY